MSTFGATPVLLAAMSDALDGPFGTLWSKVGSTPLLSDVAGPTVELFRIGPADAGLAVGLTARRTDGRLVSWQVETLVYASRPDDWAVNVKAEIDLDDADGEDRCVLNEQTILTDPVRLTAAVATAATLVTTFPLDDLLTAGWQPPDWAEQ